MSDNSAILQQQQRTCRRVPNLMQWSIHVKLLLLISQPFVSFSIRKPFCLTSSFLLVVLLCTLFDNCVNPPVNLSPMNYFSVVSYFAVFPKQSSLCLFGEQSIARNIRQSFQLLEVHNLQTATFLCACIYLLSGKREWYAGGVGRNGTANTSCLYYSVQTALFT